MTAHFADGHAIDADTLQCRFDFFHLEGLHDRFDFFHHHASRKIPFFAVLAQIETFFLSHRVDPNADQRRRRFSG